MANLDTVEQQSLALFTEKAYLDYSMYVILDRAIPHIGDGLKPVQRRIIYAMSELHLNAGAKYKKSARTVGDVIGKFHPHGDSACYEAMVLMAQSFMYRYPIVDGQGNWGSADDPKSFAAMRYTESRLTKFAEVFLSEVSQGTVTFMPNFDATLQEPMVLPARLPTLLLNGTMGIAVGMSTDIPPHNLNEVADACLHLLDNPKATSEDLCHIVKGPDYPTDAEIISSKDDLKKMYCTGSGSVRMRAVYSKESQDVVITALPYQVSGAKILEQIALQMRNKKLPMVEDLRDESDHENPTRLVITPKTKKVDVEALMAHLFATTDLERTYRVNMNVIGLDQKPKVFALSGFLKEWLQFRIKTVRARIQFRLDKIIARLHILDALLIAFLNIDEVIDIIRNEDKPKQALIERFSLTEIQADAILDTKLRQLARLEEMKIKAEQSDLAKERDGLEKTLASDKRLKTLIKKEITEAVKQFGDERRSPIVVRGEAKAMSETERLSADPVTIVLSNKGWIRAAKGHEIDPTTLNYKSGDEYRFSVRAMTNVPFIVLDSTGRSYSLPSHSLPSARSLGEPLTGRVSPPSGASFQGLLTGKMDDTYIVASDAGYGFCVTLADMCTKNKSGKALIKLSEGALLLPPLHVTDPKNQFVAMISNEGRMLIVPADVLPVMAKGKGIKILSIPSERAKEREEYVIAWTLLGKKDPLTIKAGRRKLTLTPKELKPYHGERGRRGGKLPRGYQKVSEIL